MSFESYLYTIVALYYYCYKRLWVVNNVRRGNETEKVKKLCTKYIGSKSDSIIHRENLSIPRDRYINFVKKKNLKKSYKKISS